MADRPTLHITNWASRKLHGPGRRWTIMARPRRWERGEGVVADLTPNPHDLADVRDGRINVQEYRDRFLARAGRRPELLTPDMLVANQNSAPSVCVSDGDTLCCACSRDTAEAGACHRVWAAELLVQAGWRVILDGRELEVPCG